MASILDALLGRVPPNGGQGSVPMTGGQFRPQNAPLGGPGSSANMRYNYPNPRAEAAGYTTSSAFPGAPAGPPTDMSVAGPWGAGIGSAPTPSPRPDRGPQTTGASGPPPIPQSQLNGPPPIPPEMLNPNLNVQTPTSVPNPAEFNAQSPSSLGSFLPVAQSPSSLGGFTPTQSPTSVPGLPTPGPLPPEIVPAPASRATPDAGGPSSARPPKVIHPDNPTAGKLAKGKDRAQTPKRKKGGGQYNLRQEGSRRANK